MKRLVLLTVLFSFFSNICFATCDWTKIVANPDGTYTYSKALNLCVGQLVQDNATKTQQIADYTKALTLKDFAITKSDARGDQWMATSLKLEESVQKVDS